MEYLVLVEKRNGNLQQRLFTTYKEAEAYKLLVLATVHTKAAFIYRMAE
jgi:hypothetical protein